MYAAGLVLYEAIAGRGPFDDEGDPQAIGAAHMDKAPPPLSLHVDVPRELEALVMSALSKAPEDRPRDAYTFAAGPSPSLPRSGMVSTPAGPRSAR